MTHESGQRSRSKAVALNQRIPVEAEDEGTPPETASHRLTGAREDPVERLATSLSAETPPLSGDAAGMSRRFPPQSTLSLPDDIRWQPAGLDLGDPEAFSLRNDTDLAAELARDLELLEEASRGFESSLIREGGKPVEARSPQDAERVQLNESPRQTTKQDVGLGGQHNTEAVGSGERPHAHQEHAPTKPSHQEPVSMKTKSSSSVASDPPIANRQDSLSTSGDAGLAGRREEQAEQLQKMKDDNTQSESSERSRSELEAELKQTRAALQRLREQAAKQTRMHGSVGEQTRKLDQRTSELRTRVAKAQEALNERGRKLQAGLVKEMDRLREYHAKLQEKAKEFSRITQDRKHRFEEEVRAQREAIASERAELESRRREIEGRVTEAQDRAAEIEKRSESFEGRAAELDRRFAEFKKRDAEFEKREAELEGRAAEIEKRSTEINDREAELEKRSTELDGQASEIEAEGKRAIEARRTEIEQAAEARLAEIEREAEGRRIELDEIETRLATRESELAAKIEAAEAREKEDESAAARYESALAELREELAKSRDQLAEGQNQLAESQNQFVDSQKQLTEIQTQLSENRNRLSESQTNAALREREVDELKKVVRESQLAASEELAERDRRDQELARLSAAMEIRERRLQEWQSRIEKGEAEIEASLAKIEERGNAIDQKAEEAREQAARNQAQLEDLREDRESLERDRQSLTDRQEEIKKQAASADARSAELDDLKRELEHELKQGREAREQYADLEVRENDLDRQREELAERVTEMFGREEEVRAQVQAVEHESAEVDQARQALETLRAELEPRKVELEAREEQIGIREEALARREEEAEAAARRVEDIKSDIERERAKQDVLREGITKEADALTEQRAAIDKRQGALDEALLVFEVDRREVEEQRQAIDEKLEEQRLGEERLKEEREALSDERRQLTKQNEELSRQREGLASERSSLEAERANFERAQVGLKDRERAVSEGESRIEEAEAEVERKRGELAKQVEETGEYRRQLAEKAARLTDRKERLAEDAAKVDDRVRELDAESEKLRQAQEQFRSDKDGYREEKERFDADCRDFARKQEELEQSRQTFQAGLRNLEERQRDVADREAAIGRRAGDLELYRDRLEEEFAELGRQREELLSLQAEHSDSAENVRILMDRAESRQKDAADREAAARAHEEALSARAAELARAEQNFKHQAQELDTRRRELAGDADSLERERKEFESVLASEREELDKLRQQGERELAEKRAKLEKQSEEMRKAVAAEREAIKAEAGELENTTSEEARRKLEEELSERLAVAARKEEEVQQRCKARLAELESDIEQRLGQMEQDIRRSREEADREILDRQRAHEEQLQESQDHLDEQLADLRVRQAAVAQEQSLLRMRQREMDADHRAALLGQGLGGEGAPVGGVASEDNTTVEDAGGEETVADVHPAVRIPERDAETLLDDEVDPSDLEDLGTDAEEDELESGDELELEAEPGVLSGESHEKPDEERFAIFPETSSDPNEHSASMSRAARRFRPILTSVLSTLVGCVLAVIWMWSPTDDVVVIGQLVVKPDEASGTLTAEQHHARMVSSETLEAASQLAGVDLDGMYRRRNGKIDVAVGKSGEALELRARATMEEQAEARRWLEAWADAYEASLKQAVASQSQLKERLAQLGEKRQQLAGELRTAEATAQATRASLATDPRMAGGESSHAAKERLKKELIEVRAEVDAAKTALAEFTVEPEPADPIVPTPEQFAQAYASDEELMQAVEERDANAIDFHSELTQAMSESQVPLSTLLTAISTIVSDVDAQLAAQPDKDIRREIEEVAVDLRDYLAQAEEFSRRWDDLAPKVGAWKSGGDAELLLEYQKRAETLIREFHAGSRISFGDAARKIDAIGRGGSEMTKRRVIQNQLLKASNVCLEARNEWIIAARGAVPRYNLELKALRNTIRDITPRITERRRYHLQRLGEQLLQARADERVARGQQLRQREADAVQRHQQLSDRFLKLDAVVAKDDAGFDAELEQRRRDLHTQEETVAGLREQLGTTDREMQHLRGSDKVSLAGSVSYTPLTPFIPSRLDPEKWVGAASVGGSVTVLLMLGTWVLTRPKRSARDR